MKRILTLLLILGVVFCFASCDTEKTSEGTFIQDISGQENTLQHNTTEGSGVQPSTTKKQVNENKTIESGSLSCSHESVLIKNKIDPTCEEKGYTGDTYCVSCNVLISKGEEIKANGHSIEIKNKSDASCTEDGYTGDKCCNLCDVVIEEGTSIKAIGHDTEVRNQVEASYTEDGYTGDTYCNTCGLKLQSGEIIPKLEDDSQQEQNTKIVYITKTGKKYHSRTSCSGLSNANEIFESNLESAQNKGLGPCSKCY